MEESFAAASISSYHGDSAANAVSPVQVAMDPVKSDAFRSIDAVTHDCAVTSGVFSRVHLSSGLKVKRWHQAGVKETKTLLLFGFRSCSPVDLLLGDVRPVDLFGGHVHVKSHSVLQTGDHSGVLTFVQSHLSDFMTVGEEKVGYCTCKTRVDKLFHVNCGH